jgi:hypothetical protein
VTPRTKTRPVRTSRHRWLVDSDIVPVVAAAAIAIGVAFAFLHDPAMIDAVAVSNPTDYDIAVAVRGTDGGWMPMSTATRNTTTTVNNVLDQGDTWTFRFTAQGKPAGELHIERDALEAAGWAIEIPPTTESILRAAGAQPPP